MPDVTPHSDLHDAVERSNAVLHRTYLDGLRGLAALWVLLYHLNGQITAGMLTYVSPRLVIPRFLYSFFWCGHDAVAVFIVLSGYVLALPVFSNPDGALRGGLKGFLSRRARRILPPYYASLALGIVYTLTLIRYENSHSIQNNKFALQSTSVGSYVAHVLIVHNFWHTWSIELNPVLWSVALEWQIYFLFALVLLPLWRVMKGATRASAMLVVVALSFAIGYAPLILLRPENNLDWTCPWLTGDFALGMLGAAITEARPASLAIIRDRMPWGIICLLGILLLTIVRSYRTLNFAVSDSVVGFITLTGILYCESRSSRPVNFDESEPLHPVFAKPGEIVLALLRSPFAVWLGPFSYSLYLTHTYLLAPVGAFLVRKHPNPVVFQLIAWTVGLAGSFVIALIFHRLFEKPFLRSRGLAATNVSLS